MSLFRMFRDRSRHQGPKAAAQRGRFETLERREMLDGASLMAGVRTDLMYAAGTNGTQLASLPCMTPFTPVVNVGSASALQFFDIAVVPNTKVLYGVTNGAQYSELYTLDASAAVPTWTHVATLTGYLDLNAADFRSTNADMLYLAGPNNSALLQYRISTGVLSQVGQLLGASSGDLAYQASSNRCYYVDQSNRLCWYDLDDASKTQLGVVGQNVFGLDWDTAGQHLYAFDNPTSATYTALLEVNPADGSTTDLGHYTGLREAWGMAIANVPVDVVVSPTSGLVTNESGTTDTFTVGLFSQPLAEVTVGFSSSDTSEGTVSPAVLTFTPSNWNVLQTVTVTGQSDAVADGDVAYTIVTSPAVSADPRYDGIDPSNVSVVNQEPRAPGFEVAPTSGLVTTEAGGTATFTVRLNTQPTLNVTIGVSSSRPAEGTATPASLVFTAADWGAAQTVTVTGVDDAVFDGDQAYTVVLAAATGGDSDYNGLDPADVSAVNRDDDAPATVGLFDPGQSVFYLRNSNSTGAADYTFGYGDPAAHWKELVGDWDGNRTDTVGFFDATTCTWYLRNSLTAGYADWTFGYGAPSLTTGHGDANWIPLVGDWDGNGTNTIGFFDPASCTWYLRNSLTVGYADWTFGYGAPSATTGHGDANWIPLVGDWDGNGTDTIGFFDPATCIWYLRNDLSTGFADYTFGFGDPTSTVGHAGNNWAPITGDWNGNHTDTIGFFEPASSTFMLRNSLTTGAADLTFGYGATGSSWHPMVGTWTITPAKSAADAPPAATGVDQVDLAALVAAEVNRMAQPESSLGSLDTLGKKETDWLMANAM